MHHLFCARARGFIDCLHGQRRGASGVVIAGRGLVLINAQAWLRMLSASPPCYHSITHYLKPITAWACWCSFQHAQRPIDNSMPFCAEKKGNCARWRIFMCSFSASGEMLSESWYSRLPFPLMRESARSLQGRGCAPRRAPTPASLIELFRVRWGRIDFLSHHLHRTSPGETLLLIEFVNSTCREKQYAAKYTHKFQYTKLVLGAKRIYSLLAKNFWCKFCTNSNY